MNATLFYKGRIKHHILVVDSGGSKIEDGQPLSTNYLKLKELYPLVAKADANDIFVNDNTIDVPTLNTVLINTLANVIGNYIFITKDGSGTIDEILIYDREILNEYPNSELAEVGKFMDLNETALDSEGNPAVDVNGIIGYAWKSTTEVE